MDRRRVRMFGYFIESKKAKLVFVEVVMQIVFNRDDSADGLVLVVVANENFARCRFVKRMRVDVQRLSLHDFERMDDGGVIAIDFAP